jgi:serine protease AprX
MTYLKPPSPLTIRWGAAATAVLTASALCIPATQAQVVAGAGVSTGAGTQVARTSDFSSRTGWGSPQADKVSKDPTGTYKAALDPGSLYSVGNGIGARGLWAKADASNRVLTGQGVSVALLDSGVRRIGSLSGSGKVTDGPDLSIEGNGLLSQQDTYGHGTFMAGIIAGRGTTGLSSGLAVAPADVQLGVAPDAKVLSMKLATTDGSTDVSQVIAALDWVTQNPIMRDGTRVRVINLAYGTSSSQSYLVDPVAAAAENAWRHGIVVVTSAGNDGSSTGRLTNPAIDPYVIAVGASDNHLNASGWSSDTTTAADFSQVGSTTRSVDLIAPGKSLTSLRAPGSFIDVNNPLGRIDGDVSGTLFRGSGTSQAAAVVSGSVALLLQAYPKLTPDQVKYALTSSAHVILNGSKATVGAGTLDLAKALIVAGTLSGTSPSSLLSQQAAVQAFPVSTGLGSIDAARGGSFLVDAAGVPLTGEIDAQGNPWRPAFWWRETSKLSAWSGGKWLNATWTGSTWSTSSTWASSRWSSSRWSTANWSSATWTTARWSSSRWSDALWSDYFWS